MANKIKKSKKLCDCIRSDQSKEEIVELFEDKAFYKWYKKKYLNDTSRPQSSFNIKPYGTGQR